MSDDLIPRMRERLEQLRSVKSLAYDPRIIEVIDDVIESGEADIRKLESGDSGRND